LNACVRRRMNRVSAIGVGSAAGLNFLLIGRVLYPTGTSECPDLLVSLRKRDFPNCDRGGCGTRPGFPHPQIDISHPDLRL
jgi:hypothetical protein